jgi:hypothetical protein
VEPLARQEWNKMIGLKKATVGGGDDVTIHSHDFAYYNQVLLSLCCAVCACVRAQQGAVR